LERLLDSREVPAITPTVQGETLVYLQDEQERELTVSTPARFVSDPRSVTKHTIVSSLLFSKLCLYSCGVFVLLTDARMLDKRALPMQGVLLS